MSDIYNPAEANGVSSLNGLTGAVSLASPGGTVVFTPSGSNVNIDVSTKSPGLLSTTTGINAKTVANTALYTVPAAKTAVVTWIIIRCTAAAAITVGPTVSVGRNATSYNDIYASEVVSALTNPGPGAGSMFGFGTIGMSSLAAAADVITLALTNASTGTSQTIAVDLIGYLV